MNIVLVNRIKRKLQRELIRRKLIEFFSNKGYTNFDSLLYPPNAYDLPIKIPELYTRCEIIPSVEETDTTLGVLKISWSLFVLGTNRLHLGCTTHSGQSDIVRSIIGDPNSELPADMITTPNRVISFILKILDNSKNGYVELPSNFVVPADALTAPLISRARGSRLNPSSSGSFYSR